MVVEDDPEQRDLLTMLLERTGMQVTPVNGIVHALELLEARKFDLVVSDYALQDGFASELAASPLVDLKKLLIVSGHGRAEIPIDAKIFPKPVDVDEFLEAATRILGGVEKQPPASAALLRTPEEAEAATPPPVELRLYVSGAGAPTAAARRNLQAALDRMEGAEVQVEVIDLSQERGDDEDRVFFTPTLVRRRPLPRAWIIGDLSSREVLEELLVGSGLQPRDAD